MIGPLKSSIHIKDIYDLGQKFFYLGVFSLPSALPISGIFFLLSLMITYGRNNFFLLKDRWNIPILGALILIIFSTCNIIFFNVPNNYYYSDKSNILLGLFNWIPLFFAYWGFQENLKTESKRLICTKFLIAGSVPVLISCILQISRIFGPFKTFFGLIVWFNKPFEEIGGLTGLFSNPNYLGIYLIMILPFIFFLLKIERESLKNKIILFILLFLTIGFAFATNSRNAFLGVIFSSITLIKRKKIITSFSIFLATSSLVLALISKSLQINLLNICAGNARLAICKFIDLRNNNIGLMTPRIKLWNYVIALIKERPIFGWGSSSFQEVFVGISYDTEPYSHTHNLFFEMAYNFGIPVSLILSLTTVSMLIFTLRELLALRNSKINNALNVSWVASFFILLFSHISDVTYYDGKISLMFVILIAGLRCILKDIKDLKKIILN